MKIKIFALTHKKFEVPQDKMYQPLQVGREEKVDLGYLCDNTGDNISAGNCYYSELTGLYWIWKNVHTYKYVGTCHYRRYLLNEQEKIFTEAEYLELLKDYDLITTKRVVLNNSYHYDGCFWCKNVFCGNVKKATGCSDGGIRHHRRAETFHADHCNHGSGITTDGALLSEKRKPFSGTYHFIYEKDLNA